MMKKSAVIIIACLFAVVGINAQESSTPANSYSGLESRLAKSEKAKEDPNKNSKAKFWIMRADLLMDIYEVNNVVYQGMSETEAVMMFNAPQEERNEVVDGENQVIKVYEKIEITFVGGRAASWKNINKIHDTPLSEAIVALEKAKELDVEGKLNKKIKESYERLTPSLLAEGSTYFTEKDFEKSFRSFESIYKVNSKEIMEGKVDTIALYFAGLTASRAGMIDESIRFYELAIENQINEPAAHIYLKNEYFAKNDTAKGVDVLLAGFKRFPDNQDVLIEIINHYLITNSADKALNYLHIAQEEDPDNLSFVFAEATLYDKMGEVDKAVEKYQMCIDADPDYFDAYYNIGVVYFNKAVKLYEEANTINDNAEYKKAKEAANAVLSKALEPMEKAHELKPEDQDVLTTLKTLYYRLQMQEKLDAVKAKLNE